jgi:hypothetical protein
VKAMSSTASPQSQFNLRAEKNIDVEHIKRQVARFEKKQRRVVIIIYLLHSLKPKSLRCNALPLYLAA